MINYTKRTINAILAKEDQYVYWPAAEEREHISKKIGERSHFKSCVGFVDGTFIRTERSPSYAKNNFYSYKRAYGISTMLVCDHKRRIRVCVTGCPGAIHDNNVYQATSLAKSPHRHFSPGEYILADSAYSVTSTVISSYRTGSVQATKEEIEKFNLYVAQTRIAIEHCNGILKGKFQSLQELRITIRDRKTLIEAGRWIRACCIMHNFLLEDSTDIEEFREASGHRRFISSSQNRSDDDSSLNFRRNQLKNDILHNNAQN